MISPEQKAAQYLVNGLAHTFRLSHGVLMEPRHLRYFVAVA